MPVLIERSREPLDVAGPLLRGDQGQPLADERGQRGAPQLPAHAGQRALLLGGVLGLLGIENPRRRVAAEDCAGGQLTGVPNEGARQSPCDWQRQARECGEPAAV